MGVRGRCAWQFALLGAAEVVGVVAVALGRQCAQAFGGEKLAGDYVEYALALAAVEGRVVKADCDCHVGAYRGVGVCAVDKVVEVSAGIEEGVDKWFLHLFGGLEPFLTLFFEAFVAFGHTCGKHRALYHRALNSTSMPVRRTTGAPLSTEFIHDAGRI